MMQLRDMDLQSVREIYCEGGEEGFRTVFVRRTEKKLTQEYSIGSSTIGLPQIDLILEGGNSVNIRGSELIVVATKEILVPFRAMMLDKSVVDIAKNDQL